MKQRSLELLALITKLRSSRGAPVNAAIDGSISALSTLVEVDLPLPWNA